MNVHSFNPHSQQFIALVYEGELDKTVELLKEQPSILIDRNVSEETPLYWLAIENKPAGVKLLLEHGADPNTKSDYGDAVLYDAARLGNTEVVALLIAVGAEVDARHSQNAESALHTAAQSSPDPSVIDQLIDAGADVNAIDHLEWTPLHGAAMHGNLGTAERLLSQDANASQIGGFGETPLEMVNGLERPAWEALVRRFERGP